MTAVSFDSVFKVVVTGGAGYCGSALVPELLKRGYHVTVFDLLVYGFEHLPKHANLEIIRGDIRDVRALEEVFAGADAVISLACISNDASFELDEALSTTINYNAFEPMVRAAKDRGVKRFIYASSSSVYGVSDADDVDETHPLVPLTLYNKYKGLCEPILNSFGDDEFTVVTFRPATVCGYAPRLRLDLSVNILTNHAISKGKITVFGGKQLRPNLDVRDYVRACLLLLEADHSLVHRDVFNVGYQNLSIENIALVVKKVVEAEFPELGEISIQTTDSDDNRSYHINSDKIYRRLGFSPLYSIEDAVKTLCDAFRAGQVPDSFDNKRYYNIRTMQKIGLI